LWPCGDGDAGKLLFRTALDAEAVGRSYADEYGVELEMAQGRFLLAMTSVADTQAGFDRLLAAVRGVNARFAGAGEWSAAGEADTPPRTVDIALTPRQALARPMEDIPVALSIGRICGELIAPCPPGITLLAPGERIPAELRLPTGKAYIRVLREEA